MRFLHSKEWLKTVKYTVRPLRIKYAAKVSVPVLNKTPLNFLAYLIILETFEKCQILFKFKEGENFNRRNILNISRIKI